MMQVLKTIRDFMKEDTLKNLVGNLHVHNCILIEESKMDTKIEDGQTVMSNFKRVLHVFESSGVYVGTIEHPHYIPKSR